MSHTPTPWRKSNSFTVGTRKGSPIAFTGYCVGFSSSGASSPEEAIANTNFIVKACNSYEEMLEDLRLARAAFTAMVALAGKSGVSVNDLVNVAEVEILKLDEAISALSPEAILKEGEK